MQIPVVMLGANFYTALGAIRTLGRRGVPVFALDYHFPTAYALASRYVTKKLLAPNINDAENALVDYLVQLGSDFEERPVLMATADNYALLISRHAELLARYYRFPNNQLGLLEKIIDKKGLNELSSEHDFLTPLTFVVDRHTDLNTLLENIPLPCIIKPALSHKFVKVFRQKCLLVHDFDELKKAFAVVLESNLEVMVQEIIPGFDDQMYVFDFYVNHQGIITHTFSAQKLRQFPINYGSSTLTHQLYDRKLTEQGLEYVRRLDYRGYGEIEFKKDPRTGEYCLIEINARLSTLNILFDKCGLEFTYVMYRDLIGKPLPEKHITEDCPWAFWHAYEDAISVAAYLRKKQLTLREVIKPWLSHHKAHAVWAADDPKPLFSFSWLILKKLFARVKRVFIKDKKQAG